MSLIELADLAVSAGFDAICMRASQIGVHSSAEEITDARRVMDERGLKISMISGDFDIVYNNSRGPALLRNIKPYLDLAESLGSPLIRVCLKQPSDIAAARTAADQAAERNIKLVHQCHVLSLFETLDGIEECLREIDRPNFGLIFEAANLEQCSQDYGPSAVMRLAPWIENVYLQNQRMSSSGAITLETWCQGSVKIDLCEVYESAGIDFLSVFQGLDAIGYDGTVTVHQSAPIGNDSTALESATMTSKFLKTLTRV